MTKNTKGVIRSRKLKDRQYNDHKIPKEHRADIPDLTVCMSNTAGDFLLTFVSLWFQFVKSCIYTILLSIDIIPKTVLIGMPKFPRY
jgi:hypothetical protein